MPSDSKKREQMRKKEAQKKRNQKITTVGTSKDDEPSTNGTTNGVVTNGAPKVEMTEEGMNKEMNFYSNSRIFFKGKTTKDLF